MITKTLMTISALSYTAILVKTVKTYRHWRKEKEILSHYNDTFFTYIEDFYYKKSITDTKSSPQLYSEQ